MIDLDSIERVAQCAQGNYYPDVLADCVYHGNAAKFVAEVGTPDVVLALVARVRELEAQKRALAESLGAAIAAGMRKP